MFPLGKREKITAVVPVKEFDENHYVFMATAQGTVKKTRSPSSRGRGRAASSRSAWTKATTWSVPRSPTASTTMLFSSDGKAVRFQEGDVRPMGRQATGVRGMRLGEGQRVVCMLAAEGRIGFARCSPPPRTAMASAPLWPSTRATAAAARA